MPTAPPAQLTAGEGHELLHSATGHELLETTAGFSEFKTAEEEMEAFECWLEMQAREPKRPKVEPQTPRAQCPACAANGW